MRPTQLAGRIGVVILATTALPTSALALDYFTGASGFRYVLGGDMVTIADPPSLAKGVAYTDPAFGLEVVRVTDGAIDGFEGNRPPGYSCFPLENVDGTYLALAEHLYDQTTYAYIKKLGGQAGLNLGGDRGVRWDATDPDIFYYSKETALMRYHVSTDQQEVIHDFKNEFPEMVWLLVTAYVEPSVNRRYWGLSIAADKTERGAKIAAVTYDMQTDTIVGVLDGAQERGVAVSPSGQRVLVGHTSYKLDFTDPVELSFGAGHSDLAIDTEGNDVLVITNGATDYIDMINLETGDRTHLVSYVHNTTWAEKQGTGYNHLSGNATETPGWVLVSCEGKSHEAAAWMHQRLFMLELKENPRIWTLAHDYADLKGYWYATHASINVAGSRVTFGSNWWDVYGDVINTFQVDLPEKWYEDLMGKEKADALRAEVQNKLGLPFKPASDGGPSVGDTSAPAVGSDADPSPSIDGGVVDPTADAFSPPSSGLDRATGGCAYDPGSSSSPCWPILLLLIVGIAARHRSGKL